MCLLSSGALFFGLSLMQPLIPMLPAVAALTGALGGASYLGYLFNRRRSRRPPPPEAN
jgi:hypothetical protein